MEISYRTLFGYCIQVLSSQRKMKLAATSNLSEKYPFLSRGGEMGELMRTKDWSANDVGNPDTWPQSLRTTLSILLNSRFPMFLFWGPDLICFYNDAYRPSLGQNGKHPSILGQKGVEAWPEIWTVIKPLLDSVLSGGEATWSEDQLIPIYRNGKMEDVYWTFSYSPVNDESGKTAGVFVTCTETTEKIYILNKLEESKDELHFALDAANMATWDYNPATNKFKANERLKEWFGLQPEEEIDLPLAIASIAERDRQRVMNAIETALNFTSGGQYDIEYAIANPVNNKERIVRSKGKAWFDDKNTAYRFNGTSEDVTEKVVIRQKAEAGEKEFRNMVKQSPIGITVLRGREFMVEMANDAYLEVVDRKEESFVGRPLFDSLPEVESTVHSLLDDVLTTGIPFRGVEYPVPIKRYGKQQVSYFDFLYSPLKDEEGNITGIIVTVTDVTEKVEARKVIEASEKEFRQLADTLPELVWTTDGNGKQTFASFRWKEYTGLDPYDAATFEKMAHPEDLPGILALWADCLASGKLYKAELRLKNKEGDYKWFEANGEPIRNEKGEIEKWIGAFSNIHERIAYEHKLKADEERLNIIIKASDLGTWDLNVKTREIHYSDRYLEIFGYPERVELTHEKLLEHMHPEDLPVRENAFKVAFETGVLQYESRLIWKDKSIHWIEGKGQVFYDEHNQPVMMMGTARDITEEKYYQKELEEREMKFRLLANSMPQFVWTGDAEGNLNYFNQAVYNYSGVTPAQMQQDGWLQIVHDDDKKENIEKWVAAIQSGHDFLYEHRFRRHDGEYRWQLSRAIPQRDAAGNIQMWVGTSTDIQEIKELDQQKDFFISMASHELKTPITAIKGYVQLLQSKHDKGEDNFLKNSLRVINKQIDTLTTLISDLLDLSKIKSGSLVLNKENFEVGWLIKEIIEEIKHINPNYSFEYNSEIQTKVFADRERVGQVVRNFFTNAVKYSPDNKIVKVAAYEKDNNVIISVEDSGIGISKANQERIFERFFRVEGKNEKTFPGFGIGLFICAEIIRRHGGTIHVNSEPGKGSVFYFSLPL